ncbi:MAG: FAD-binding oxidoreductase [Bacillota bacterium]
MTRADIVIVGGGIVGCSIAYHLAQRGMRRVVVLERSHIASGATGRCGAGVRMQWGTKPNCLVMKESIRMLECLEQELCYPHGIAFKQKGYLFLAHSEAQLVQFQKNVQLQNSLGIPSEIVGPREMKRIAPLLDTTGIVGGSYCSKDGHCDPFHTTRAYALAAMRLGVTILQHTELQSVTKRPEGTFRLSTSAGEMEAPVLVNAAGAWSGHVGRMLGVELPVYSERHQILVTEQVERVLDPMIISLHEGLYCQQTPDGSFIMGLGDPNEPKGIDHGHTWQFLFAISRKIARLLPGIAGVRILRQWSGLYNMSPDRQAILGAVDDVPGFYVACGFSGHGFMMAPAISESMADIILGGTPRVPIDVYGLDRFKNGNLFYEPSVV